MLITDVMDLVAQQKTPTLTLSVLAGKQGERWCLLLRHQVHYVCDQHPHLVSAVWGVEVRLAAAGDDSVRVDALVRPVVVVRDMLHVDSVADGALDTAGERHLEYVARVCRQV